MAGIQKHTKTPWGASHAKSFSLVHNVPLGEYAVRVEVTGERRRDDAAFIVRAVNSHEALVDVVKRAREELWLIRMKDAASVYDPALSVAIELALKAAEEQ